MKSLTPLQKILSGTSLAALMLLSTLPASGMNRSAAGERESFVNAAVTKAREEAREAAIEKTGLVPTRPELNLIGNAARAAAEKEFEARKEAQKAVIEKTGLVLTRPELNLIGNAARATAEKESDNRTSHSGEGEGEGEAPERVRLSSKREIFLNAAVTKAREEAREAAIEKTGLVPTRPELNLIGNAARAAAEQHIESINKTLTANADSLAEYMLTAPSNEDVEEPYKKIMSAAEFKFFAADTNKELFLASLKNIGELGIQKMKELVARTKLSFEESPEKTLADIRTRYRPDIAEEITERLNDRDQ